MGIPGGNGMITRPGRLDLALEFGVMDLDSKIKLVQLILGEDPEAPFIVTDSRLITPAQVQARCAEIALEKLYSGEEQP